MTCLRYICAPTWGAGTLFTSHNLLDVTVRGGDFHLRKQGKPFS